MNITLQGASSTNHLQTEHTNIEKKKLVIDGSSLLGKQEEEASVAQSNLNLARKKATDVLKKALEADQGLRGAKEELKSKNKELKQENEEKLAQINDLEKLKEEKKSEFTNEDARNALDAVYGGLQSALQGEIRQNQKEMRDNIAAEKPLSQAILKSQFMVDGQAKADAIMEDANHAFLTSSMQEIQQDMDKTIQETVEATKEKAEEKQKQEEQIEESQKEDDQFQEGINSSAQKVLEEVQKLFGDEPLDEDLKGLIIDALS